MTIAATDIPFLPRGVRLHRCEVRQDWFLLAPERAVKMDRIGTAILGVVDGTRSFDGIVEKLAGEFNAPRGQIADDVARFLNDLSDKRMMEFQA